MDSIKRLREYVEDAPRTSISLMARSTLLGMARDIEREVEQLREREYQNGREDAGGAVEFADRLCRASERREDVTLWGVDYTALPIDADGEVIHIGELVDEKLPFGGYAAPAPIDTMELSRGASGYRWMVKLDAENRALVSPKLLRHHHAPTVEDVLEELLREYDRDDSELTNGEIIERFAAKLQLKEG